MNVLLVSCSPDTPGGVAAFVKMLMRYAPSAVRFDHFVIGSRPGRKSHLPDALKPMADGIRLIALLRRKRYAGVHVNPSFNWKSILRDGLFILILHAMGLRNSFISFHGWSRKTEDAITSNKLLKAIFKLVYTKAGCIGVLSSRFRRSLIAMGIRPEKIILFTTMFEGRALAIDHASKPRHDRLFFMSRLVNEKGCHETLAAFQILHKKYPSLQLIVAGDGPERRHLMQSSKQLGLQDAVKFPGWISGLEKAKVLNENGIFVFPTYYGEGCPIVLLEAMGAGMAIVTSRDGGIPDILEDGRDAVLLAEPTPEAVVAAVDKLLSNPQLLSAMQSGNRQKAWKRFEARIVSRDIHKVYQRLFRTGQSGKRPVQSRSKVCA